MKRLKVLTVLLLASCSSGPASDTHKQLQFALELARGVGDAIIRIKGMPELLRRVPELVPFIDKNDDAQVTLEEVEAFLTSAAANPQSVALLVTTLALIKRG